MTTSPAQPAPLPLADLVRPADDALLRHRLKVLCVVYLVLIVILAGHFFVTGLPAMADPAVNAELPTATMRGWIRLGGFGVGAAIVSFFLWLTVKRHRAASEATNAATLMILMLGAVLLASRLTVHTALPDYASWGIIDLVLLHLALCAVMPLTPRECTLPLAPLLLVWAAAFLVPTETGPEIVDRVVMVIISPLVLLPGAIVARWTMRRRHETAQRGVLEAQVELFGGELSRARIVHDAMFPPPFTGNISFEYEYLPIHEIGGDYVHTYACPETGNVTLTLLDVAGHGLAAALTVNRLFGELERILAENSKARPGEIMQLLNRYINLTMSRHSLFATGTCMRLEPTGGALEWVSAGHPPTFVRHANGQITEMATTTMLLGVLEPDEFQSHPKTCTLSPGDVVIAFTDGAFEARDSEGRCFGMERIRETASFDPPPRNWPRFIANAVAQHHEGHAEDDVLIAALTLRSLRVSESNDAPDAPDQNDESGHPLSAVGANI